MQPKVIVSRLPSRAVWLRGLSSEYTNGNSWRLARDLWHVSAAHRKGWYLKASPSTASCNAAEMSIAGKRNRQSVAIVVALVIPLSDVNRQTPEYPDQRVRDADIPEDNCNSTLWV